MVHLEFIIELIVDFVSEILFDIGRTYALSSKRGARLVRWIIMIFLISMSGLFLYLGYRMRHVMVMMAIFYVVSGLFFWMLVRFLQQLKSLSCSKENL